MKKMQQKSKRIHVYKIEHMLPLKPSHRDSKHQAPPHKAANREASRSLVKISANCLYVYVFHHYIPFLNMVSQEVVSHFDVFGSPMKSWVFS
jgi:hypothetical protein